VEDPETWMEFSEWGVNGNIFEKQVTLPEKQWLQQERATLETTRKLVEDAEEEAMDTQLGSEEVEMSEEVCKVVREEDLEEVLLHIDAMDGFNILSRLGMLWTVRHHHSKRSRLASNCYHHQVHLVCRQPGHLALILLSKEGVTQGDLF
jgi:hypothetical protein